ncbi:META domain-containing protein [Rhodobacter maris]|uniref:Heat shock protein HslJ n=1 Tax=Rhodobacter maris TaxID=446682 RepID=A0A285T7M9_9RHOB|nr:META domain-containing protein [Rhodobacter maris]SOC15523.1 heat shock protein HslJ [Rhodobacter maris]
MRLILIAACAALALAGCKDEGAKSTNDPLNLIDHAVSWHVTEIDGAPVPEGVNVTLSSPEPGLIAGSSGCNRYSGPVAMRENLLHVGELVGTRMMCDPATMAVEEAFHSTLSRARGLRLAGEVLEFTDLENRPLIRAHK